MTTVLGLNGPLAGKTLPLEFGGDEFIIPCDSGPDGHRGLYDLRYRVDRATRTARCSDADAAWWERRTLEERRELGETDLCHSTYAKYCLRCGLGYRDG